MCGGEKTNYENCNHVLLKVRELQLAFSDHKVIEIRKISKIDSKIFSFGIIATDLNRLHVASVELWLTPQKTWRVMKDPEKR